MYYLAAQDLPEKRADVLNRLATAHRYLLVPVLEELTTRELEIQVGDHQWLVLCFLFLRISVFASFL
jgi:hypothetical protein